MNFKDNYIINSLKSRPVLFGLVFFLGCILAYQLTSSYTKRTYEKKIVERNKSIKFLEQKVQSLKTEMSKMSFIVTEEYSEKTGKLLKKYLKKETEVSKKEEEKKEVKVVEIVEKIRIVKEKEVIEKNVDNSLFVGYGYNLDFDKLLSIGYMRRLWMFQVGVQGVTTMTLDEYSGNMLLGIQF